MRPDITTLGVVLGGSASIYVLTDGNIATRIVYFTAGCLIVGAVWWAVELMGGSR